jgi:hypothetical protein
MKKRSRGMKKFGRRGEVTICGQAGVMNNSTVGR